MYKLLPVLEETILQFKECNRTNFFLKPMPPNTLFQGSDGELADLY